MPKDREFLYQRPVSDHNPTPQIPYKGETGQTAAGGVDLGGLPVKNRGSSTGSGGPTNAQPPVPANRRTGQGKASRLGT